jgi:hypothetical protein
MLVLFLLEMGMVAKRQIHSLWVARLKLLVFGIVSPMIQGTLGILL